MSELSSGHLSWTDNFAGSGKTEVLLWTKDDAYWWLGTFLDDQMSWTLVSWPGWLALDDGVHLFWTGDFTGLGKAQIMLYAGADGSWWLGTVSGSQMDWAMVGNPGWLGLNDGVHLFWAGDFTGSGKTEVMAYSGGDGNWWLGTVSGSQMDWAMVGNPGWLGLNDGAHLFWTGDFTGSGKAQVMAYSGGDGNWWLGTVSGSQMDWAMVGNPGWFNLNDGAHLFWAGDFTGSGTTQIMAYSGHDGNWWLGTVSGSQISWEMVWIGGPWPGPIGHKSFPAWHTTARQIVEEVFAAGEHQSTCASIYLDTLESHRNPLGLLEGHDHHQGIARTHLLTDGSVFFFLAHSEMDFGEHGNLMQFRYPGPVDGEHVQTTQPLVVAPLAQLLETISQHPCDMAFLPEVNGTDNGYLFVAEQTPTWAPTPSGPVVTGTNGWLGVYRWSAGEPFQPLGTFDIDPFDLNGLSGPPNYVFLDRFDDTYILGVVPMYDSEAGEVGQVDLFTATADELFPEPRPGLMKLHAFQRVPADRINFPVDSHACQVHAVRDVSGKDFVLAFHSEPPDKEDADNFVDVHRITFDQTKTPPHLEISKRITEEPIQVNFRAGTSFASTGTAYVEASGRLLLATSYRWSKDEGPGHNYVSRVDECPS
jgi:hypothetical protein